MRTKMPLRWTVAVRFARSAALLALLVWPFTHLGNLTLILPGADGDHLASLRSGALVVLINEFDTGRPPGFYAQREPLRSFGGLIPRAQRTYYPATRNRSSRTVTSMVVPLWTAIPATLGVMWLANIRTRPPGLCRKCGYDLRATPADALCPECGRTGTRRDGSCTPSATSAQRCEAASDVSSAPRRRR